MATPGAATTEPAPSSDIPASTAPSHSVAPPQHSLTDPASPWVVVNKHRPLVPRISFRQIWCSRAYGSPSVAKRLCLTARRRLPQKRCSAQRRGGRHHDIGLWLPFLFHPSDHVQRVRSQHRSGCSGPRVRPPRALRAPDWLSFDIGDGAGACSFQPCFAEQPAAVWAKANAHKFGFVVRYPWMFHDTTGYFYESWHLRYIGVEAATDMVTRGIATVEEYFGLEAAPDYL